MQILRILNVVFRRKFHEILSCYTLPYKINCSTSAMLWILNRLLLIWSILKIQSKQLSHKSMTTSYRFEQCSKIIVHWFWEYEIIQLNFGTFQVSNFQVSDLFFHISYRSKNPQKLKLVVKNHVKLCSGISKLYFFFFFFFGTTQFIWCLLL